MADNKAEVATTYPEDTFQHIFWKQKEEAARIKQASSMRWHPLIIKWCLYLRHVSGRAYETLWSSGVIRLPSQRTLRDYTHFVSAATGFSDDVDKELAKVANAEKCLEREKYIIDEMYIKEDLVYNKHTYQLVAYLSNINSHLLAFEQSVVKDISEGSSEKLLLRL